MIGIAPARKRAAITAVVGTALVAVAAVVALGLAAGSGGGRGIGAIAPSPTSRPTPQVTSGPLPLPFQGPEVAARFDDPVGVGALLRLTRADVAARLRVTVTAIGLVTKSGTQATALAFVAGARYVVALRVVDGRPQVTGLVRDGAADAAPPGTPGLAAAVLAAQRAVVGVLKGTAGPASATKPYRAELARAVARLGGVGTVGVDATAVAVTTGDSATVLVAATRGERTFRFVVTVARPGYEWLVGDLRLEP